MPASHLNTGNVSCNLITDGFLFLGPCKGVRGFWIQISNGSRILDSFFKQVGILDSNLKLVGFRIQIWAYRALFLNVSAGRVSDVE